MNIHGVELYDDGDMVIAHQNQTGKPFEAESVAAWQANCTPGGMVLDIGAYTGLYAIAAANLGSQVMAFEPNPMVFDRLLLNLRINEACVMPINKAVSDKHGTCGMIVNPAVMLTSGGKLSLTGDTTEVITVDSLDLYDVTAIKIDVEGHECNVLMGALQTIERCNPVIITEVLSREAWAEQSDILCPLGYRPKSADEQNVIWSL